MDRGRRRRESPDDAGCETEIFCGRKMTRTDSVWCLGGFAKEATDGDTRRREERGGGPQKRFNFPLRVSVALRDPACPQKNFVAHPMTPPDRRPLANPARADMIRIRRDHRGPS